MTEFDRRDENSMNDYLRDYMGCSGGSCGSSYMPAASAGTAGGGQTPDPAPSTQGYGVGYQQPSMGTQTTQTQMPSAPSTIMVPPAQPPFGSIPAADMAPITALNQPMPITTLSLQYINGFLRTQIGKKVNVEFLIGTNTVTDRTGTLMGVGANYLLLNEVETDDLLICDFFSVKFVRVYY